MNKEIIEKMEKEQREKDYQEMMGLKIGSRDTSGNIIDTIFSRNDYFAIYGIDAKCAFNSISYSIAPLDKEIKNILGIIITKFRTEYNNARSVLHKSKDMQSTKAEIAGILLHGLTIGIKMSREDVEKNDFADVKDQFTKLIEKINKEYEYQFSCRLGYMTTILVLTIILMLISAFVYWLKFDFFIKDIYLYLATMGSIGCALSVSGKLKRIVFEEKQEKGSSRAHIIGYACQRILISVFCAIVSYFAIKANLLFGFANYSGQYIYLVIACVAGFSETLIPDFLTKIENKKGECNE